MTAIVRVRSKVVDERHFSFFFSQKEVYRHSKTSSARAAGRQLTKRDACGRDDLEAVHEKCNFWIPSETKRFNKISQWRLFLFFYDIDKKKCSHYLGKTTKKYIIYEVFITSNSASCFIIIPKSVVLETWNYLQTSATLFNRFDENFTPNCLLNKTPIFKNTSFLERFDLI